MRTTTYIAPQAPRDGWGTGRAAPPNERSGAVAGRGNQLIRWGGTARPVCPAKVGRK
jgi:hypothetical protein